MCEWDILRIVSSRFVNWSGGALQRNSRFESKQVPLMTLAGSPLQVTGVTSIVLTFRIQGICENVLYRCRINWRLPRLRC